MTAWLTRPVNVRWFHQACGVFPAAVFVSLFIFIPLTYAINVSMTNYRWGIPGGFAGLNNYLKVIRTAAFSNALYITLKLLVITLPAVLTVSFVFALILQRPFPGNTLILLALLIPYSIPGSIDAAMWRWLYDPRNGIVQYLASLLGFLPHGSALLGSPNTALYAIILAYVWKFTPYTTFIILAALKSLPTEIFDAARLDCNCWQSFLYVTIPLLKPVIFVTLSLQTIFILTMHFSLVYVLTGGGPVGATTTLAYFVFLRSFEDLNFGEGSALAIFLALIMMLFIIIYYVFLTKARQEI